MKLFFVIFLFNLFSFNLSAQYAWLNTYSYSLDNFIDAVDTTSDQGYFLAGGYQEPFGNFFAAKLDSDGNEIWHTIGTKYNGLSGNNSATCIVNSGDGGCLVGGIFQSNNNGFDLYFIRLDSTGQVVWEKTYGGINDQYPSSIIRVGNNYLCSFISFPNPYLNALLELSDQGDSLWSKNLTIGISSSSSSMIRAENENIIICGTIRNLLDSSLFDLAYCELDTIGNILNIKRFPDTLNFGAQTINQTIDGGFLLSSSDYLLNGISKIIKADSSGIIQWVKEFNNNNYYCVASALRNNDVSVSFGSNDYSINIYQFDSLGNLKASDAISIGFRESFVSDNITDRSGNLILSGYMDNSNSCQGCPSFGMILKKKLDYTNSINELLLNDLSNIKIYPNPLNSTFSDLTIESKTLINKITIIDLTGNIIFQRDKINSIINYRFQIHLTNQLSAGAYFVLFENNSGTVDCKKLIVFN